jgi:hypothetical protein
MQKTPRSNYGDRITVTMLDCTPSVRHANFCDRLSLRMTDDRQNGDQNVSDGVQIGDYGDSALNCG